jgi:hypothetical protein
MKNSGLTSASKAVYYFQRLNRRYPIIINRQVKKGIKKSPALKAIHFEY